MMPSGQPGTDQVAQAAQQKYLRIIRVKHFQAATGDELASLVRDWFIAETEDTTEEFSTIVTTTDLSENREMIDWRYQVSGETHHIMLLYVE